MLLYLIVNQVTFLAICLLLVIFFLIKRYVKQHPSPYARLPTLGRQFLWGNALHFAFMRSKKDGIPRLCYYLQTIEGFAHLLRKEGMCFARFGTKKVLLLYAPDTVEPLLSNKSEIDKAGAYKPAEPFLGQGLLTCRADKWRKSRKLVSPAFNNRMLEDFLPTMNKHSRTFVNKIRERAGTKPIDIAPLSVLCAYDIILETAMGVSLDAQSNTEEKVLRALQSILKVWVARAFNIFLKFDTIFNTLPISREFYKNIKLMDNFGQKVIELKKAKISKMEANLNNNNKSETDKERLESKRKVFIDLLLTHQKLNSDYTDEEIIKESLTFIGAGHDSTAYTVTWALFLIGQYPEIQEKIREELQKVLGDDRNGAITPEHLKNLVYLECAIKETLRINPIIPMISRKLRNELQIGSNIVPRNTNCIVLITTLHRNPIAFPNPEIFDPARFLPENNANISQYSFVPFAAGPRVCIGQKYAFNESKILLADILRNFVVKSMETRDKYAVVPHIVGKPHKPIMVTFIERSAPDHIINPIIPMISRKLRNELQIGSNIVPRNTNCIVLITTLHRNPIAFPNPEIFDPARFLPENNANISQYSFVPFAAGPRVCIGQKYAFNESKILLADILRNFVVKSMETRDKYAVVPHIVGKPHKPIMVTFIERSAPDHM